MSSRRRSRRLWLALFMLPLAAVAVLAWHRDVFAPRSRPDHTRSLQFTDDGAWLVSLDASGTLRIHEVANPLDLQYGARRQVDAADGGARSFYADRVVRAFSPERVLVGTKSLTQVPPAERALVLSFEPSRVVAEIPFAVAAVSARSDLLFTHEHERVLLLCARRLSHPEDVVWARPGDWKEPETARDGRMAEQVAWRVCLVDPLTGVPGVSAESDGLIGFDGDGCLLVRSRREESIDRLAPDLSRRGSIPLEPEEDAVAVSPEGTKCLTSSFVLDKSRPRGVVGTYRVRDVRSGAVVASWTAYVDDRLDGAQPIPCLSRDGSLVARVTDDSGRLEVVRLP